MKLPKGFLASGMHCGIKSRKPDVGLLCADTPLAAVGFFTVNRNESYSVRLSRRYINNPIKALIVNSGNANCFTHTAGLRDTDSLCRCLAQKLGVKKHNILIASTGIIGRKLPRKKIVAALPALIAALRREALPFSQSILTTDTFPKAVRKTVKIGAETASICGFAKGAGMIHPTMATMLAFILTDAGITKRALKISAKRSLKQSFNAITIDGCMSTNDSVYVLSSGKGPLLKNISHHRLFQDALDGVFLALAKMIVKDAEGASKFIELTVKGAKSRKEAHRAALAIANSVLFKTAMFGENPNWGRIIAALGHAGIKVSPEYFRVKATSLKAKEVVLIVYLARGAHSRTIYTNDLTPTYVKINAGYS